MQFEKYLNVIDEKQDIFCHISDSLWDNPETCFGEYFAADLITGILEENGFTVTRNVADIPTAFTATYGTGSPSLGILAEYDGLEGMSQVGASAEKESIPGKDKSHGCGHNLFAGGSVAAAFAVKRYIEETGKGSITLFGCPAEENGGGKVFMARAGVFNGIESIVSWHPEKMYMVRTRPALANVKVDYTFEGIAAHAGANPDKGRSALDALELMNVGANFLREHMDLTSRLHYAILDTGGSAPNMVQSHAKVRYMIRAVDVSSVKDLHERVNRIAQGAALMTDTEVSAKVIGAYANLITIPTLQATANEAMHDIPLPVPTEEEMAFGRTLQKTMTLTKEEEKQSIFPTEVLDPAPPVAHGGSTDTADVSWNCPTVQMHIGNWVVGTPGHSWQSASQSRGTYAKKAMLYAGKAVAGTLIRLFENPELVEQAKKEHKEKIGDGYVCGLPEETKPIIQPRTN
ncbi:MAG: amidohydrolase [Ruminococcaceae bacterium]|nr:amidohydrolase [Oscillospiraceae bacterium]